MSSSTQAIQEEINSKNEKAYMSFLYVDNVYDNFNTRPLYIYNVSAVKLDINRPPNFPRMLIKPCPEDQEYIQVGSSTHPFIESFYDTEGLRNIRPVDGIREVSRLLCPFSPITSKDVKSDSDVIKVQNLEIDTYLSEGDQYNKIGVFWSFNNPPKPEEIEAAVARMEKTYKQELSKMSQLEMENPANAMASANRLSRAAADYFDENTSWHKTIFKKAAQTAKAQAEKNYKSCEDCGFDDIPEKAKKCFHCGLRFEEKSESPEKLKGWQVAQAKRLAAKAAVK